MDRKEFPWIVTSALVLIVFFTLMIREGNCSTFAIQYNGKLLIKKRDYYYLDLWNYSKEEFNAVKKSGAKPICYFSSHYENFRPDHSEFPKKDLGKAISGWSGEKWVNTNSQKVREIIKKRILLAKDKGCEGIDPDNIDSYAHNNGLKLSKKDAIDYVKFMSTEARALGMIYSLKNALLIIEDTKAFVDIYLNESCQQYSECWFYKNLTKPIFGIEYKKCKKIPYIYTIRKHMTEMGSEESLCG